MDAWAWLARQRRGPCWGFLSPGLCLVTAAFALALLGGLWGLYIGCNRPAWVVFFDGSFVGSSSWSASQGQCSRLAGGGSGVSPRQRRRRRPDLVPEVHGVDPRLTFHSDRCSAIGGELLQLTKPGDDDGAPRVPGVLVVRLLPFRRALGGAGEGGGLRCRGAEGPLRACL